MRLPAKLVLNPATQIPEGTSEYNYTFCTDKFENLESGYYESGSLVFYVQFVDDTTLNITALEDTNALMCYFFPKPMCVRTAVPVTFFCYYSRTTIFGQW